MTSSIPTAVTTDNKLTTTTTTVTKPSSKKESNEFWFTFPENHFRDRFDDDRQLFIFISSKSKNKEISLKISQQGRLTFYKFIKFIAIGIENRMQLRENKIESKGIRVVTDSNVSVSGYNALSSYYSDAFNVLSTDQLGTWYVIISHHPHYDMKSFVSILAVLPNTTVDVTLNTTDTFKK